MAPIRIRNGETTRDSPVAGTRFSWSKLETESGMRAVGKVLNLDGPLFPKAGDQPLLLYRFVTVGGWSARFPVPVPTRAETCTKRDKIAQSTRFLPQKTENVEASPPCSLLQTVPFPILNFVTIFF